MKKFISIPFVIAILFMWSSGVFAGDALQFVKLGDYRLENGQVIRDCRVAYRTFGVLNADKSNVVLFPTWLAGTTKDLVDLGLIGQGKIADSSKYFIVAVDALGNGVSSSPSNSRRQPNGAFPQFAVKDMVNVQYILLTKYLHLTHIYGVIGISMGAMMAYQWMVSYPDFMDKAVAVAGSPRLTSYDLLFWQAELNAIATGMGKRHGQSVAMKNLAVIHNLHLKTPRNISANVAPEAFGKFLAEMETGFIKFNLFDWAWQLKAIMHQDIYRSFGEAVDPTAKTIKAKTLIIWSGQDLIVNPEPARTLAGVINAETFEFSGDCGHLAFLCESDTLSKKINNFMQ